MRPTNDGSGAGARSRLRTPSPARPETGAVTAETMMVLPLLVAVSLGLAWLLAVGATQLRVVDAAREVARAAARDEPAARAVEAGRRVAPAGARITIRDDGSSVVVDVVALVRGPGGLFRFLPSVDVDSTAVAAKEPR
jgi:Flp pilus assembly protein TadG